MVVVSFVPLLQTDLTGCFSLDSAEFERLQRAIDACPSGLADACLWVASDAGVAPVFVLPEARAIARHLRAWAEDRVPDWFCLCFVERRGRYVASLFPNLLGSVERFRSNHAASMAGAAEHEGYGLLFEPVAFVSERPHTFGQVRSLIAEPSLVGFLDSTDFDPTRNPALALERVVYVGPVRLCWDGRPFGFDIEPLVVQWLGAATGPGGL